MARIRQGMNGRMMGVAFGVVLASLFAVVSWAATYVQSGNVRTHGRIESKLIDHDVAGHPDIRVQMKNVQDKVDEIGEDVKTLLTQKGNPPGV